MTTRYETGYVSGYTDLKQNPGACPACQPYVAARRHVFLAREAKNRSAPDQAIEQLKEAIRKTPKHIDGSYLRYVAGLTIDVVEIYLDKGDLRQAKRWLKSALRVAPDDARALDLQRRINAPP